MGVPDFDLYRRNFGHPVIGWVVGPYRMPDHERTIGEPRADGQGGGAESTHLALFIAPMRHPTTFHYRSHVGGDGESAFLYLQKKIIFTIFGCQLSKLTNCSKIRDAPVTICKHNPKSLPVCRERPIAASPFPARVGC